MTAQRAIATKSAPQATSGVGTCAQIDELQTGGVQAPDVLCDPESVLSLLCSGPSAEGGVAERGH